MDYVTMLNNVLKVPVNDTQRQSLERRLSKLNVNIKTLSNFETCMLIMLLIGQTHEGNLDSTYQKLKEIQSNYSCPELDKLISEIESRLIKIHTNYSSI